jgi:SNF2-related domain
MAEPVEDILIHPTLVVYIIPYALYPMYPVHYGLLSALQGADRLKELQDLLSRYLLRRTKALIKHQLPQKNDHIVFCQLSDMQLRAYRSPLATPTKP